MVKVVADESNRGALTEIANVYKAKIIDLSIGSMIMELTGEPNKLDGFLSILSEYTILEVCRTGITALSRGANVSISHSKKKKARQRRLLSGFVVLKKAEILLNSLQSSQEFSAIINLITLHQNSLPELE